MTPLERLRGHWRRNTDRWLLGAAAVAAGIAVLHPTLTVERPLFSHVVVIDVTQSMNVEDRIVAGKPASRLAFAKHSLRQALTRLPCGSKVGWGIFTEYRSFLLFAPVEVCANLGELRSTLDRIDGRMAWTGNSEVAKGLYSGLSIATQLPDHPSLVFVTDGHEAPPINPRHRPRFDGTPGAVPGLVVGVGALKAMPIPKFDPSGAPLGYWGADEVLQVDPRSAGRGGSVGNEKMIEDPDAAVAALPVPPPGSEHLSSLREGYLQLLADETRLGYHRLEDVQALSTALTSEALAKAVPARTDMAPLAALVALVLLLGRHASRLRDAFARWRNGRALPAPSGGRSLRR